MDKKLNVGILGTWRGKAFAQAISLIDEAEVTAICDNDPEKIDFIRPFCSESVKVCNNGFRTILSETESAWKKSAVS